MVGDEVVVNEGVDFSVVVKCNINSFKYCTISVYLSSIAVKLSEELAFIPNKLCK